MFSVDLVVIGLGYVGLPLAQEACRAGLSVVGVDVNPTVVEALSAGRSHVDDLSGEDIETMLARGFRAQCDPQIIRDAATIVICVPTPLSEDGGPDLTAVRVAGESISRYLSRGHLVVLESTTWPGTTEEVLLPILIQDRDLEVGEDFCLAFSPERIDPGNPIYGFRNTPKVVGGVTQTCSAKASEFYSRIVDNVVTARGTREAEMTKLLENTYRHVNIALVNEMAKFSHEMNIDLWDVIRCASTKPFGFQAFSPGPGVGGHCIPIDPNYLSYKVRAQLGYPFRFVELAQEVNLSMPAYIGRRVQQMLNDSSLSVRGSRVLLLGVAYKPNISDDRESPARPLARWLISMGAEVSYHDPKVQHWIVDGVKVDRFESVSEALDATDVAVLLQAHSEYDLRELGCARLILDGRGVLEGAGVTRL